MRINAEGPAYHEQRYMAQDKMPKAPIQNEETTQMHHNNNIAEKNEGSYRENKHIEKRK